MHTQPSALAHLIMSQVAEAEIGLTKTSQHKPQNL